MKKLIGLIISIPILFAPSLLHVTAESPGNVCIVEAIKDDYVILSNGCELQQSDYHKYSGNQNQLICGDVLCVEADGIDPIFPGRYVFTKDSNISYLGIAKDYYIDVTKKLTLMSQKDGNQIWQDADGKEYKYTYYDYSEFGYIYTINPKQFEIGDAILGAVCNDENDSSYMITILGFLGDVNMDNAINIMDVIKINKYILGVQSLDTYSKIAADFNSDGMVDATDSLNILKICLEIKTS